MQVAENLVDKGILDAVVASEDLAGVAARVLDLLTPGDGGRRSARAPAAVPERGRPAWESVPLTRRPDRPGCASCCGTPPTT